MSKTAARFREVRSTLGLSRPEMGTLLNVSEMTIYRWENSEPDLDEKKRDQLISIGINPSYILMGEPEDFILESYTVKQSRDLAKEAIQKVAAV